MRVLHVLEPDVGGVPRWVARVADAQRRLGDDVVILGRRSASALSDVAAGVRFVGVDLGRRSDPRSAIRLAAALRRAVAANAPDVVHLHSTYAGIIGRLMLSSRRRRVVFQPHCFAFVRPGKVVPRALALVERALALNTSALAFVSADERDAAERHRIRRPHAVVGVPVSDDFDPERHRTRASALRLEHGIGPRDFVLLCVGRFCRQKGQDRLLRWWPASSVDAHLVLVGEGTEAADLPGGTQGSQIHLVGASNEVAAWMTAADLLVQPSRWEGHSMVVAEAMTTGLPSVATRYAGAVEAVRWSTLTTANEDDLPGMSDLILRLRERPALLDRLASSGRAHAAHRYSVASVARNCRSLYSAVDA